MYTEKVKKSFLRKDVYYWMGVVVFGIVLGAGLQFATAMWTSPPPNPPAGNVPGPITTGSSQVKYGGLVLNAGSMSIPPSRNGLLVPNGFVGVGTLSPSAGLMLDIEGNVGAKQYCDENGRNCFTPNGGGSGGIYGTVIVDASGCNDANCTTIVRCHSESAKGAMRCNQGTLTCSKGKVQHFLTLDTASTHQAMYACVDW